MKFCDLKFTIFNHNSFDSISLRVSLYAYTCIPLYLLSCVRKVPYQVLMKTLHYLKSPAKI